MLNLLNLLSLKRLPLLSQFHIMLFYVLLFHVLQFHVLSFGPSLSRPSFSRPAFSAPPISRHCSQSCAGPTTAPDFVVSGHSRRCVAMFDEGDHEVVSTPSAGHRCHH